MTDKHRIPKDYHDSFRSIMTDKMMKEWDNDKNNIPPENLTKKSMVKTFWKCSYCDYSWSTSVKNIANGSSCPVCARMSIGDITKTDPYLLNEWDDENNGNPRQYSKSSKKKVWWKCPKNHTWASTIPYKIQGADCPYCANRKVIPGENDFQTLHPELMKEWDNEKNMNNINPWEITDKSTKMVFWQCSKGHKWNATINDRTKNHSGCPYCNGRKTIHGYNDVFALFPYLQKEWDESKNKDIKPENLTRGSSKKVWWICQYGHSWRTSIRHRTIDGSNCPYCFFDEKRIVDKKNSFAVKFPELLEYWDDDKNIVNADEVGSGFSEKVWWKCDSGHHWLKSPKDFIKNRKRICPFCSNRQVLCGDNDLATTDPWLVNEWSKKNSGVPSDFTRFSTQKVFWECNNGHEWSAVIASRVFYHSGCRQCGVSQAEKDIRDFIQENYRGKVLYNDRQLIAPFELDLFLPDDCIAIEYNGLYWHSRDEKSERYYHYNKWLKCRENGVQLITIWEDDWLDKTDLIKNMLLHKIGIAKDEKVFARNTFVDVLSYDQASSFLNSYHIQGSVIGSVYLGLRDKNTKGLIAVSVWKNYHDYTELSRYSTSCHVIGGLGKLLKYFQLYVNNVHKKDIVTFADHQVSGGDIYDKLGFVKVKELSPDYKYVYQGHRVHKFNFRKKRFENDPELLFKESLTEKELAQLNNIPRVYDCGKTMYKIFFNDDNI